MNLSVSDLDALPVGARVKDKHGDIWTKGTKIWYTPETAPFFASVLVKKWGPLTTDLGSTDDLPGMWEKADFEGGAPDVVRGPDLIEVGDDGRVIHHHMDMEAHAESFNEGYAQHREHSLDVMAEWLGLVKEPERKFQEGRGMFETGRFRWVSDYRTEDET